MICLGFMVGLPDKHSCVALLIYLFGEFKVIFGDVGFQFSHFCRLSLEKTGRPTFLWFHFTSASQVACRLYLPGHAFRGAKVIMICRTTVLANKRADKTSAPGGGIKVTN